MAVSALPVGSAAADARIELTRSVSRVAWTLYGHAINSERCTRRLTVAESEDLTLAQRIDAGDREAIYDAIVEACEVLDALREQIGESLADNCDTLDRLAELQAAKRRFGSEVSALVRFEKKDARRTDPAGREPQRSGMTRKKTPARHG